MKESVEQNQEYNRNERESESEQDEHEAHEEFLMNQIHPPSAKDLANYERNATEALLLFHLNSGVALDVDIDRIPTIPNVRDDLPPSEEEQGVRGKEKSPVAEEDCREREDNQFTDIINEAQCNDNIEASVVEGDVPENLLALKEELKRRIAEVKNAQGNIYERCVSVYNGSSHLLACGACGVRAFQFDDGNYNYFDLDKLGVLKYSEQQKQNLLGIEENARKIVSFYVYEDEMYHIHPEFVEMSTDEDRCPTVRICPECTLAIRRKNIPKFSIASGVDFGHPARIGLVEPTIAEQYSLALACPYVTVFKLVGHSNSQRQSAKRGHAITYLHDSPNQFSRNRMLPRVDGVTKFLSVCFVGSRLEWEAFVPSFRTAVQQLIVRPNVVYSWLYYLKQINPFYKDIEIVDNEALREALASITTQLINNTVVMDSTIIQNMETVIESETASIGVPVVADAEQGGSESTDTAASPIPISHCFVNNTNAIQTKEIDPISAIFRSVERTVLETTDEGAETSSTVNNDEDELGEGERESETDDLTDSIAVGRERTPINEFSNNDVLFFKAFPCYFTLGKGIVTKGTFSAAAIRHIMFQFSNRMAQCHRMIFLLFDQKQRHAVARIVSSKVKTDPTSLQRFGALIRRPRFLKRLREAAKNPNSEMAKKLLKEIMPFIQVSNSKVPFTKASRKASLSKLLSLTLYHGLPSIFLTIAPDDIQDPNRIRMSLPQKNNVDFPAEQGQFLQALQNNDALYCEIAIERKKLAENLVKSPIAAAEMFNSIVETINSIVLGIEPEHRVKKTTCLESRKSGVFGKTLASAGSPEEQGRGSLHCHFCVWSKDLSPKLLQAVAGVPGLRKLVCALIDEMVKGDTSVDVLVESLLRQYSGKRSQQATFYEPHHPTHEKVNFEADVARTIGSSGIHSHNGSCRKSKIGLTGCRLGRPQPCRCCTTVTQIVPVKDAKGVVTYKELSFVMLKASIPESFDRCEPLGNRDKRLLIWELKRPVLDITIWKDENGSPSRFLSYSQARDPILFSEETQTALNDLDEDKFNRLVQYLKKRNSLVVEYNPLISAIFKCNTNVSILGSYSQAKAL